jgi:hypothetical protein
MIIRHLFSDEQLAVGYALPPWCRVAYRDESRNSSVAYLIGLHFIMRLLRRVWEWSWEYRTSAFETRVEKLKQQAFNAGKEAVRAKLEKHHEKLMRDPCFYRRDQDSAEDAVTRACLRFAVKELEAVIEEIHCWPYRG